MSGWEAWLPGSEVWLTGSEAMLAAFWAWLALRGNKWTNEWTDIWTHGRRFSPLYRTLSPSGPTAQKVRPTLQLARVIYTHLSNIDMTLFRSE